MIKSIWKYALASAAAAFILALYPQISLWATQGTNWHGSYYVSNYDEVAYSAYISALINGEPRKNDPFLGQRDTPETPQPETLYSIQFVPAYAIALPAKVTGISASTAFIFLITFLAIFSALSIFWLLYETTGDNLLSAVGAVVVLCLGTAAAYQGELRSLIEGRVLTDFFPYLRRYQPGFAFPLFFVFCVFARRAVRGDSMRRVTGYAAVSGIVFAILVYSYFYLWTAAIAWLGCFALASLLADKSSRKNILTLSAIVGAFGVTALIPYFYLLSLRSQNLDSVGLLTQTRMPEFASTSMIIGLIVAAIALTAVWRGSASLTDKRLPLLLSFALTPVILFNQQIITGRSLQPVHYELFIANYLVLISAMLLISMVIADRTGTENMQSFRRGLVYLGLATLGWGFFEAAGSTSRNAVYAEIRDGSIPAISYIEERSAGGETVVLATNFVTADFIPSVATIRPLWNPHTFSGGSIDATENKRLFYLHLYYSGFDEQDLKTALQENSFEVTAAIFGSERALPALGGGAPITAREIEAEGRKYAEFSHAFNADQASNPALSYAIFPSDGESDLSRIDRWYNRGEGKEFGLFRVYELKLKLPHFRE